MTALISRLSSTYLATTALINHLQPVALLAARLYVAWVFFAAGLTKLNNWESTLMLFEYEYSVPYLSFEVAAWLGTAGELILPVLLVVGFAGRFAALGLSVVNVVAVMSLEEIAPAAYNQHLLWGLLLVQVLIWGAGKLSLDALIKFAAARQTNSVVSQSIAN